MCITNQTGGNSVIYYSQCFFFFPFRFMIRTGIDKRAIKTINLESFVGIINIDTDV